MYSIRAVSKYSGINVRTIRSWEQRYDVVSPSRDKNGRRIYSETDLDRLVSINRLVIAGHAIGRIANLSAENLQDLTSSLNTNAGPALHELLCQKLKNSVDSIDLDDFNKLVGYSLALNTADVAIDHVLSPVLKYLEETKEQNSINTAGSHLFSNIIKQHLLSAVIFSRIIDPRKTLVTTTLIGDKNELGALMGHYIASLSGICSYYIGPELPSEDIINTAKNLNCEIVFISINEHNDMDLAARELSKISYSLNNKKIWVSSNTANIKRLERTSENIEYFHDYESYKRRLSIL